MSFTILHPNLISLFAGFTALPQRLVSTVMYISNAIGLHGNARPASAQVVDTLFARLRLTLRRLNALMIRYKSGKPMQRQAKSPAVRRTTTPRKPATPGFRLPSAKGWLPRMAPGTAQFGGFFDDMMQNEDLAGLAAASPQARRLLRPLWRMMGHTRPKDLDLPPRPKRPARPKPPAKPKPEKPTPAWRPLPRTFPDGIPKIPPAPD